MAIYENIHTIIYTCMTMHDASQCMAVYDNIRQWIIQ